MSVKARFWSHKFGTIVGLIIFVDYAFSILRNAKLDSQKYIFIFSRTNFHIKEILLYFQSFFSEIVFFSEKTFKVLDVRGIQWYLKNLTPKQ